MLAKLIAFGILVAAVILLGVAIFLIVSPSSTTDHDVNGEPAITIKPGSYIHETDDTSCFADEKLTAAGLIRWLEQDDDTIACEVLNSSANGDTLKYTLACLINNRKNKIEVDGTVTVKGDELVMPTTVRAVNNPVADGSKIELKPAETRTVSVRRIGDC